jgi:Fe2+ or Zn2+ uptake regulation protein
MGEELEKIGKSFGFSELSHVMELFGLCPECSKKR